MMIMIGRNLLEMTSHVILVKIQTLVIDLNSILKIKMEATMTLNLDVISDMEQLFG